MNHYLHYRLNGSSVCPTLDIMPPRAHVTDPAKLLPPILRLLEQSPPDAYSAQQKARTTAARLLASAHYDAAIEILFGSAKELLKLREWGSGCDLAVYLVQAYEKGEIEVTDESKGMRFSEVVAIMLIPGKSSLDATSGTDRWRRALEEEGGRCGDQVGLFPTQGCALIVLLQMELGFGGLSCR